ncbi:DNA repair protein RecO [Dysgonomonas sp. 25]|uniref:DNA repair protein RecO n=1 Tax=Dysgonomonas sp. 25 TaxID=2302933 RepID=UPI0013D414DE|nr:DNA repair protein RecO [Dysgonomonas sp. 25]NDV68018.1 DNA repair protein RecO [Dysgonomonas sp. 25]
MLQKTRGVVLNTINYNDKYLLVRIYTEVAGQVTYMVPKTKSRSNKVPRSLFSPLAVLEMEVDHQPKRDIQRIREARSGLQLYAIPTHMGKTSLAFFLSEFLSRVLRDTGDSRPVFEFISQSVQILEMTDKNIANFHLVFMLRLSRLLGFYPNLEDYNKLSVFDMMNGEFIQYQPAHRHFLGVGDSEVLSRLARITYENMHHFAFNRNDRVTIVNRMIEYYRLHLYDFPQLKSLEVLHELF